MRSFIHLLLLAFLSLGLANADTTTFKTSEKCSTIKGNVRQTPVKTVTNYMTTTSTRYPTTTVTPKSTITGGIKPVTKKSTSTVTIFTSTKKGKGTKTTTVTSLETDFVTVLNTETQMGTSTVTLTNTGSNTIPTPAGFTPLASLSNFQARGLLGRRAKKYAQSVECNQIVKEVIIADTLTETADTTTITVAKTKTVVVTSTEKAVKTVAAATITATSSATTTMTVTSTTTSVSTPTITVQDTTVAPTYDACAANNVISRANGGQYINGVSTGSLERLIDDTIPDATSCCNLCQATANCAFYFFKITIDEENGNSSYCATAITTTCDGSKVPQKAQGSGFLTGSDSQITHIVGNGQCGQYQYTDLDG